MLLVDLLEFEYSGPFEKLAYSIPVEYKGQIYRVNYEKFGMRIIVPENGDPQGLYRQLEKGMKAAKRYFLWRADQAAGTDNLNLVSKCHSLWEKYLFLRGRSENLRDQAEASKGEVHHEKGSGDHEGSIWATFSFPSFEYKQQADWLHEAAVDAFFAWCEQALVHVAVLLGKLKNGREITDLLNGNFGDKCRLVFNYADPADKRACDDILALRTEIRNYVAHGSFGKDGSTFQFHSKVGAVPLKILDAPKSGSFAFVTESDYDQRRDFERIERFLSQLWSGKREPAKLYIETNLPCILTYVTNGKYQRAMRTVEDMKAFLEGLTRMWDDAANMDW
ncbi:hypothetical protein KUV26_14550 [Leisingera daeponensis]|uniref:Apea-like HEPN domain-containing protein n=1 Tax=Leisingera daeponensis TaxID=405746 RepID=A0ABS7NKJ9_9RHOB|nr:hypothetical protein [Leisingera daeponensis]MBY6140661.1 hypothetical protein [Leisingera daeponensis]